MTKRALTQTQDDPAVAGFQYDAFLSYSTGADYTQARKVEAFLESFHKSLAPAGVSIRQMQICRDGSDFKLPSNRQAIVGEHDPIWDIIEGELTKARYLVVLCSPESTRSDWVSKELTWMVDHRGPGSILAVVTKGSQPTEKPEECFPAQVIAAGLHKARLWYDLRSWSSVPVAGKVRDAEDELVRLASDLLGWDAAQHGQLAPLWLREQLKRRRRQATLAIVIAAALIVAAALVIWRSLVANREANRARANAVVLAADASSDPLTGALLLSELEDYNEPDNGTRVAQKLSSTILPSTLVRGHTGRLLRVAFNPSQTRILTASSDNTARLWPVDGKGDPVVLRGHTDSLTDAQFNSDGLLVVTASKDKTVRVWRERGGEVARVFEHDGAVVSAQFSGNKQWVATVTELDSGLGQLWRIDGTDKRVLSLPDNRKVVRIWLDPSYLGGWIAASDVTVWGFQYDAQGKLILKQVLPSAAEADKNFSSDLLDKVTFSPDGSHVAVIYGDKVLTRSLDGKVSVVLAHEESVNSVDFNNDGTQLVSSCSDGKIRVWNTQTPEASKTFDAGVRYFSLDLSGQKPVSEDTSLSVSDARFSHNGSRVAAIFDDSIVRIWNLKQESPPTELRSLGAEVIAFSKDDTQLVSGGNDGTARIWPLSQRREPLILPHDKPIYAASISEDKKKVAIGSSDGTTRLWQLSDPANQVQWKAGDGSIKGIAFDNSGTQLATAQDSGTASVWDITNLSNPVLKKQFAEAGRKLQGVQFSPNGQRILAWSDSGKTYIWSINGGDTTLPAEHGSVWHAEFNPDGDRVVVGYDDGAVLIWKTDGSGSHISLGGKQAHTDTVFRAAFSPDGLRVLTVSKDGTARLWRSDGSGDPITITGASPGKDWLENCAFSPDGKKFVITSGNGRAWVFPADGQGKPNVLRYTSDLAHIGSILSVVFSSDSNRIVTAGGVDGIVRIWQADGSGQPMTLSGHEGAVTWAAFSEDGSRVISTSEDGTARIWRTGWRELVSYLRSMTSASLTAEERMIYLGESESDARAAYEAAEKRFGRTPLPANWQFINPF